MQLYVNVDQCQKDALKYYFKHVIWIFNLEKHFLYDNPLSFLIYILGLEYISTTVFHKN